MLTFCTFVKLTHWLCKGLLYNPVDDKGYSDNIFHVISKVHIQQPKFGRRYDNFDRYSKNVWIPWGLWDLLFQTPGTWHLVALGTNVR